MLFVRKGYHGLSFDGNLVDRFLCGGYGLVVLRLVRSGLGAFDSEGRLSLWGLAGLRVGVDLVLG